MFIFPKLKDILSSVDNNLAEKSPVVVICGPHKYERGEIRLFNSLESIRVELIDSLLRNRVKEFSHSELRFLDKIFSDLPDLVEIQIDGLKWPEDREIDEMTISIANQVIPEYLKLQPNKITSGEVFSKSGKMYISRIKDDSREFTLEVRILIYLFRYY